ncbi:MAG: ABC transporter permease [Chloroflexi bacterium RBG_16_56_8]|nr:MAG: ABC transporter permease [Chloroflexi bacterium RBG_16_56_8]
MHKRDVLFAALALFVAWQIIALILNRDILPAPTTVLAVFFGQLPQSLGWHFVVSTWRVVASIAISVLLATPAGLVLGQNETLNRFFAPVVYLTYPIPKIVLLPIVLLFLGIGDASKIFIIVLILFFQVLVVVRDQASAIRQELLYSVRSLGAGRRALLRFVYLPATLPAVLTAIRLSIGTAVAVLFFTESFATSAGLGYYVIVDTFSRLAYPEMYAGVVAMSVMGLMLYFVVDYLERALCPYLFAK